MYNMFINELPTVCRAKRVLERVNLFNMPVNVESDQLYREVSKHEEFAVTLYVFTDMPALSARGTNDLSLISFLIIYTL